MTDAFSSIEALARAIHEDHCLAVRSTGYIPSIRGCSEDPVCDNLSDHCKRIRREQARLMFERLMR